MVDLGFLSVSSAKEIPIEPLYKDPLLCVVPRNLFSDSSKDYMDIEDMRNYQFVTQRECTDADIQNFLKENNLSIKSNYHVVDDLSTYVGNTQRIAMSIDKIIAKSKFVVGDLDSK